MPAVGMGLQENTGFLRKISLITLKNGRGCKDNTLSDTLAGEDSPPRQ